VALVDDNISSLPEDLTLYALNVSPAFPFLFTTLIGVWGRVAAVLTSADLSDLVNLAHQWVVHGALEYERQLEQSKKGTSQLLEALISIRLQQTKWQKAAK